MNNLYFFLENTNLYLNYHQLKNLRIRARICGDEYPHLLTIR